MAVEPAPEIEQLIRDLSRAYREGDVEFIDRHTSRDSATMVVGSDAREVAHGHDDVVAMMRGDVERRPADTPGWSIQEIDAHREGDVGWATVLGPYPLGDGPAVPARAAVVVHREDGDWKVVSWCFSFAVPNEELQPGSPLVDRLAAATA
jgi:ketosteroid isomerase-like protein